MGYIEAAFSIIFVRCAVPLPGKAQSVYTLSFNPVKGNGPCALRLLLFLLRPDSVLKRTAAVNVLFAVNTEITVIPLYANSLILFFSVFLLLFQNLLYLLIRYQCHGIILKFHPDADYIVLKHRRKKPGADSFLICFHLACVHVQYIQDWFSLFAYAVSRNHLPLVRCHQTVLPLLLRGCLLSGFHIRCIRYSFLPPGCPCVLGVFSFCGMILLVCLSCAVLFPDSRDVLFLSPGPAVR